MSRIEKDFLGEKELPDNVYYGVQTLRAVENFHITGLSMSNEPAMVKGLAYVKKAAAMTNKELGAVDAKVADAIIKACDRLIAGEFLDQFVTDYIQGGAGTSVNMNTNEVIANLALEILGKPKGEYTTVNPNDHVNCSQSTNDAYPTALHLALILRLESYTKTLTALKDAFAQKGKEFDRVLKMGRTHLQDAVPMSLGAEFKGFSSLMADEITRVKTSQAILREVNLGATAIGTSVNTPAGYPALAVKNLAQITGIDFVLSKDLIAATSDTTCFAHVSSTIKGTAIKLTKICNDLRLLASGPRCGINEIFLPQLQPGSSIMPGKVNPVIPEVVNQACFFVIGMDTTVMLASSAAQLQLNVMEPVISYALFSSLSTMQNAMKALTEKCVLGIEANKERAEEMVMNALGIVTQLVPILGYKQCSEIAREGFLQNKSLHDIVVKEKKLITQAKWDEVFSFDNLINPHIVK